MKVDLELHGLDGVLRLLQSLPPEVVSKKGGPVKLALRKGARVLLAAEKDRLRAVMGHQKDNQQRQATGFLLKSLVATRGKAPTTGKGERYLVRVKKKTYPGRSGVDTRKTASLLEYGSSKQPAEPFIRPAFQAKAEEAIRTVERELVVQLDEIVKKLAGQNRGR